ncbi:hypothetical protein J2Y41_001993 [Arthrobacter sp. 1088]|uniref:COG1470 family protein n=1 Tax=Arthrobacter sp. 1088 TaxID=2817768 RepID=UPI0028579CBB|nr:hypothetical protein [Arthrobacter sp. 1088]MDR6686432.1 hypothetical protein [Arthrobacter sp. 1088]
MDHRPERPAPNPRAAVPLRTLILALVVALVPVAVVAASSGQSSTQGSPVKVAKGITVALSPSSRSLDQGQSTTFTVSATSTGGFTGPVAFTVTGLPAGATAAWSPSSVVLGSGSTAQVALTVATSPTTPVGKSDFTVKGASGTGQNAVQSNAAPGQLQVQEVKRTFGVTGSLSGLLAPGVSRAVELQISNPGNKSIAITNLTVSIAQVVRTPAAVAANLPCSSADYQVTQYSGSYPLAAPPGPSSLTSLGVNDSSKWPQVRMLDTLQLQDGCKGATLQLTYSGTGQAN